MSKKIYILIFLILFTKTFANIELEPSIQEEINVKAGSTINLDFLIKNKSEEPLNLKTKIDLPENWQVLKNIDEEFNLEDQKLISYSIEIPQDAISETYPIEFSAYDKDNNKFDSCVSNVKIAPSDAKNQKESLAKNTSKPIISTFSYDLNKSSDSKLFFETNGSKFIDRDKKNNLEFAIKVPVTHEGTIPTKLDGKPEKFYLGYINPKYEVFLGDKDYKVSALTITPHKKKNGPALLGRGTLASLNRKNLGLGLLYLIKPPYETKNEQHNYGGFASYKVFNNKIITTILNTTFKKPDKNQNKNSLIYSFRSNFEKDESIYDFEYASTSFRKNSDAFFVKVKDKLLNVFSYNLEGIYAKDQFTGYLQNSKKLDTSADLVIIKSLSTGGAYKTKQANLKKLDNDSALRETSYFTKVKHKTPFDLASTLTFGNQTKKDLIKSSIGHKLNKVKLTFTQPIKKYTFESTLEKGIYKGRDENYLKRNWHNMHLKVSLSPFENQRISAYSKLGNFIDANLFNVGYIYGVATEIKQSKKINLSLLYEYTHFRRKSSNPLKSSVALIKNTHKIDSSFNWILPSTHEIKFKAKFNPVKFNKKTSEFALSYSIPYDAAFLNAE